MCVHIQECWQANKEKDLSKNSQVNTSQYTKYESINNPQNICTILKKDEEIYTQSYKKGLISNSIFNPKGD